MSLKAPTDPTAHIAAYRRVLADATNECPHCLGAGGWGGFACGPPCSGAGRIARFPGFRQVCGHGPLGSQVWEVRAGGLEDALAGLTRGLAYDVVKQLWIWIAAPGTTTGKPMPSADEILAKGLRLVIEIAGLTTHSPSEATITGAKYIP